MSEHTVVEHNPDWFEVRGDRFGIDVCLIGNNCFGIPLWEIVSYQVPMGVRNIRDDAIELAVQVLERVLAEHPVCGNCDLRHSLSITCDEWAWEREIPF